MRAVGWRAGGGLVGLCWFDGWGVGVGVLTYL